MLTTSAAIPSDSLSDAPAGIPPPRRDRLVKDLVASGLLMGDEAIFQDLILVPVGRSHSVWRLELAGQPVAAVKLFDPRSSETEGEATREALVHALGREVPELARLLSPMRPHHGAPELIVTDWFEGRPAWRGDALSNDPPSGAALDFEALLPLIAPPLAGMHRATAQRHRAGRLNQRFNGPLPWGLRLFDGDAPAELWANPLLRPILDHAAARPALVAGLRRARAAWRAVALIHGDLKHDNLLVGPDDRIVVIDWEMATIGDPAWDLAGLMSCPPLVSEAETGAWSDAAISAASGLISAYRSVAPLPAAALARRLVLFRGAWLLMSVIQYRSAAAEADETAIIRLVGHAEACLTDAAGLTRRLSAGADGG